MEDKAKRDEKRKNDSKAETRRVVRLILMIGGAVFLLPVCTCIACIGVIFMVTQPVVSAGEDFLNALKRDDYAAAYDQMTPILQDSTGDADRLRALVSDYQAKPESWWFSNRSVNDETGGIKGQVTLMNGEKHSISVEMQKWDDEWLISRVQYADFLLEQ